MSSIQELDNKLPELASTASLIRDLEAARNHYQRVVVLSQDGERETATLFAALTWLQNAERLYEQRLVLSGAAYFSED